VPIVLKSGSLKLLESSGPVKACNGVALHTNDTQNTVNGTDITIKKLNVHKNNKFK
jgi:hypothetical protein